VLVGSVDGFAYLVPKPLDDHGYAYIYGVASVVTAIASLLGLKATPFPLNPPGRVAGSEYLVPNPEPDHGYAVM